MVFRKDLGLGAHRRQGLTVKWALGERSLKFSGEVEQEEIKALERVVDEIDGLVGRESRVPVAD